MLANASILTLLLAILNSAASARLPFQDVVPVYHDFNSDASEGYRCYKMHEDKTERFRCLQRTARALDKVRFNDDERSSSDRT